MPSPAEAYLETQVMTAAPERLHLMVVDAAIRFARQGCQALESGNRELAFDALNRSRDCVNELIVSITTEPNPELAAQLKGLFAFAHRNLVQADLLHDPQFVRDALQVLESHRETWLELMQRLRAEQGAGAGPQRSAGEGHSWES